MKTMLQIPLLFSFSSVKSHCCNKKSVYLIWGTNLAGFNLQLVPTLMHVGDESLHSIFFSRHHQRANAVSGHLEVLLVI